MKWLIFILIFGIFVVSGCTNLNYSEDSKFLHVSDLLSNPDNYLGKEVKIIGNPEKTLVVCSAGGSSCSYHYKLVDLNNKEENILMYKGNISGGVDWFMECKEISSCLVKEDDHYYVEGVLTQRAQSYYYIRVSWDFADLQYSDYCRSNDDCTQFCSLCTSKYWVEKSVDSTKEYCPTTPDFNDCLCINNKCGNIK